MQIPSQRTVFIGLGFIGLGITWGPQIAIVLTGKALTTAMKVDTFIGTVVSFLSIVFGRLSTPRLSEKKREERNPLHPEPTSTNTATEVKDEIKSSAASGATDPVRPPQPDGRGATTERSGSVAQVQDTVSNRTPAAPALTVTTFSPSDQPPVTPEGQGPSGNPPGSSPLPPQAPTPPEWMRKLYGPNKNASPFSPTAESPQPPIQTAASPEPSLRVPQPRQVSPQISDAPKLGTQGPTLSSASAGAASVTISPSLQSPSPSLQSPPSNNISTKPPIFSPLLGKLNPRGLSPIDGGQTPPSAATTAASSPALSPPLQEVQGAHPLPALTTPPVIVNAAAPQSEQPLSSPPTPQFLSQRLAGAQSPMQPPPAPPLPGLQKLSITTSSGQTLTQPLASAQTSSSPDAPLVPSTPVGEVPPAPPPPTTPSPKVPYRPPGQKKGKSPSPIKAEPATSRRPAGKAPAQPPAAGDMMAELRKRQNQRVNSQKQPAKK